MLDAVSLAAPIIVKEAVVAHNTPLALLGVNGGDTLGVSGHLEREALGDLVAVPDVRERGSVGVGLAVCGRVAARVFVKVDLDASVGWVLGRDGLAEGQHCRCESDEVEGMHIDSLTGVSTEYCQGDGYFGEATGFLGKGTALRKCSRGSNREDGLVLLSLSQSKITKAANTKLTKWVFSSMYEIPKQG